MMAAGHVRYSTTGGSGLRNIQPLYALVSRRSQVQDSLFHSAPALKVG